MTRYWTIAGALALIISLQGCSKPADEAANNQNAPATAGTTGAAPSGEKPLVLFAQANSQDPWRQVFDADTKAAAAKFAGDFSFEEQDAEDDATKQIGVIETFIVKKPKVLLVSPVTDAVQPAIDKAMDAGIPVILLDRSVNGEKWTAYVGGDNHAIGRAAGEQMVKLLNGKGTVLMIQGIAGAPPTRDRAGGFMEVMKEHPGITVIEGDDCGYQRAKAQSYMETFLQTKKPFDAVYAHNDEMAIGAFMAMQAANTPKKIIIGIDGCQKEVVDMIKAGKLDATFTYPQPGPKGIELADDIIKGKMPADKKYLLETEMVTKDNADAFLSAHPNLAK